MQIDDAPTSNTDPPMIGPLNPAELAEPPAGPLSPSGNVSPYSTSRALIHDMTLPPIPNLDIPPSPPGSPDPTANKKFAHFLTLKKQGIHFNDKLASSSSLKNPSLLDKLMDHAGIDERTQYASSIPQELWDPSSLPSWGFKEELLKSQQEVRRQIEAKNSTTPRDSIEFVSGSGSSGSSGPSRAEMSSNSKAKSSAAERVKTGLSRERSRHG